MREVFFRNIQKLVPNVENARFLLAVSGGIDSVVMAHLFASWNLNFDIAHCNFHLRGKESNEDMNFIQSIDFLKDRKIFIKEFDTYKIQENSGKSIEMVARDLRYKWFDELLPNYDFLCTAHHANDNAETLLLNLVRGTGYRGLNAIPQKNGKILRPLLHFSSQQIENYAQENEIFYRVDTSNFSLIYHRNKIRHQLIPILEEINPEFIKTTTRNIKIFHFQYNFYQKQIEKVKAEFVEHLQDCVKIKFEQLLSHEDSQLILYEIISDFGFSSTIAEQILKKPHRENGKRFFSNNFMLIQHQGELRIYHLEDIYNEEFIIKNEVDFLKLGFQIERFPIHHQPKFEKDPNILYVDVKKLVFPLTLRHWKFGDFLFPLGMRGKKKVSDLFTDLKVDCQQKQQAFILTSQDNIVWVVGYRSDNRFKIDQTTTEYFRICR